jgi:hypothetical protein
MAKMKVTLSLNEEILKEAKAGAALSGESMSGMIEEFLKSTTRYGVEEMMNELGIKKEYTSFEGVVRSRQKAPKGTSAAKIIREMRDDRANRISR